jgi:hypothetical protein
MSDPILPEMTERQLRDWPVAVAEAQRYVDTSDIQTWIGHPWWQVRMEEESRPGRGHYLSAVWCDGECLVQISMDVYGGPTVSVGEVRWLHNGADEECDCEPCTTERQEDDW